MTSFTPTSLYGIVGYPLSHSLSPLLHTTAFSELGIPAVLVPWPTPPEKLADFVSAFRLLGVRGSCVTIPHKETVMPFLDGVTERAKAVGAVNLLFWKGTELWGDNTDVPGFTAPLESVADVAGRVLILGAGGAARAVAYGLRSLGYADVSVSNGTESRARALADAFGLKVVPWAERGDFRADLVVNTTPLGMKDKFEGQSPYPASAFAGRAGIAYDIVYTPLRTRFLEDAESAGWRVISGREMFIGQANVQFKVWTGSDLPDAAIKAVYAALGD